jgi:uncharacterized protein (UPF0248 family)
MNNPRTILNKIKWKKDTDLKMVKIWYLHRGAPNNERIINGDNIVDLKKSFIETKKAMIPYHRIKKIVYDKNVLFTRKTITKN